MLDMIRQARILLKLIMLSTLLRTSHLWQMEVIDSSVMIIKLICGGGVVVVVDRVPTFTHSLYVYHY